MRKKRLRIQPKNFSLQKDSSDCGVACLQNILRYYRVDFSLEYLRELSGTDINGTTILGLYQAAEKLGFEPLGAEVGGTDNLKEISGPCILHTSEKEFHHHYIICYGWEDGHFLLGDPAKGMVSMKEEELDAIWKSKALLFLKPTSAIGLKAQQRKSRWQWVIDIAKKYTPVLLIAGMLGLAVSILNLSMAIFSQKLIDRLLTGADGSVIYLSIGILFFILLTKSAINYGRGLIIAKQGMEFNSEITGSFYQRMLNLPKSFFDNRKTGDLISRLHDTNRIQQTISFVLGDVFIQVLLLITASVIMFLYSWIPGVICLSFIPVVFIVVKKQQPAVSQGQKQLMAASATNESNYIDNIKGIGIIKLFNKQDHFFGIAKNIFGSFQQKIFLLGKIKIRFSLFLDILSTSFLVCLIASCVTMVLRKQLLVGELIAILQIGTIIMQTATMVALTNIQLQEAKVAFDRMYEFLSIEPETLPEKAGNLGLVFQNLVVSDLSFRFPGRKPLLSNVSFSVSKGEVIAITGESGTGKSTIFQMIQKFYTHENGAILVNNKPLTTINTEAWRKTVGVVTQDPALFSGSVIENILLDTADPQKRTEVINFCIGNGLDEYFKRFPQGYDTPVGEGGIIVSGGQKQLICLARCLFYNPGILLLDEPTAAMDKKTEAYVILLLEKYRREAAIILISHKDSLTNMADRVYVLADGKLNAATTSDALLEDGFTGLKPQS
jgi:ABC-type bacteriocin/lantibiotic exporter with double-glycine peptidase domain